MRDEAARVAFVNVSNGGVPKRAVPSARVTLDGLQGDRQRDLRYHGGPERAVCLYSLDRIRALQAEGHPIDAGTTGENLTLSGLDWRGVVPGTRLRVGEVELQVTSYANPCRNIAGSFRNGDLTRMSHKRHPGWSRVYARVLREGTVESGDPVSVIG